MVEESSQEREETYGTSPYLFEIASPLGSGCSPRPDYAFCFYTSERLDHSFKYRGTGTSHVGLFFVIMASSRVYSSRTLIGDPKAWVSI